MENGNRECTCHKFIKLHDGNCDVHGFVKKQEGEFTPPESMDQVPQDRVFCTAVLFLTPDNRIAGGLDYKGNLLGELQVSQAVGVECNMAAEHLERYLRKAIDHAAIETHAMIGLARIFGITEEDLEQSNDDSNEGSGPAESADSTNVHRDSEGSSVRPVGREEDAANSAPDR
jgi:hypothetical protein